MSLAFSSTGMIQRTSGNISTTGTFTYTFWLKRTSNFGGLRYLCRMAPNPETTGHDLVINNPDGSTPYEVEYQANWYSSVARSDPLVLNEWMFWALVGNGSSLTVSYWDGTSLVTDNATQTAFVPDFLRLGAAYNGATDSFEGLLSHFRAWTAALDSSQLIAEKDSATAVRTTNLLSAHSLGGGSVSNAVAGQTGTAFTAYGGVTYSADEPTFGPPPDPLEPATPFAAENTTVFLPLDTIKQLRIGVEATVGVASSVPFRLEYRISGGSWGPVGSTGPIAYADSTFIPAGGIDTAYRLTAPSGMTTSDYAGGRAQDDENPADILSFGPDQYVELAWMIRPQSPATDAQVYEFRVTNDGTALDTYSVTPSLTVGASFRTGTLDQALGAVSLASTGTVVTVNVNASLGKTLDEITLSSSGVSPVAAAFNQTTYDLTLSSTATAEIAGDLSQALEEVAVVASGVTPVAGVLDSTTDPLSTETSATVAIIGEMAATLLNEAVFSGAARALADGTLSVTLDDASVVSTGEVVFTNIDAALAVVLEGTALDASGGAPAITGEVVADLEELALAADAGVLSEAALAVTLEELAFGGEAESAIAAAGDTTLSDLLVDATGTQVNGAALSFTLEEVVVAAAGDVAPVPGALSITLEAVGLEAAAANEVRGSLASSLDEVTASSDGLVEDTQFIQAGFRFYHDDGDEASATAWGSQDFGITVPIDTTVLLRTLIETEGYVDPKQFKLQYRKTGTTEWSDVT